MVLRRNPNFDHGSRTVRANVLLAEGLTLSVALGLLASAKARVLLRGLVELHVVCRSIVNPVVQDTVVLQGAA